MKKILRGAIFYANLNPAIGSEQSGLRPVLIIQNDIGNQYSPTTIIAPITKQECKKDNLDTHVLIKQFDKIRPNSIVLLEQIRTIDKSRLKGFVCYIDEEDMYKVNKAICISLSLIKRGVKHEKISCNY